MSSTLINTGAAMLAGDPKESRDGSKLKDAGGKFFFFCSTLLLHPLIFFLLKLLRTSDHSAHQIELHAGSCHNNAQFMALLHHSLGHLHRTVHLEIFHLENESMSQTKKISSCRKASTCFSGSADSSNLLLTPAIALCTIEDTSCGSFVRVSEVVASIPATDSFVCNCICCAIFPRPHPSSRSTARHSSSHPASSRQETH